MTKFAISAVVLTKNEENNIGRCISSLIWCDEIIIVDDFSSDKPLEKNIGHITKNKGQIRIFKRHLDGDFSAQRNFGLAKASNDWVLFVDADEIISKQLQLEIKAKTQQCAIAQNCDHAGFYIRRVDNFLGRWLKYGETGNIHLLRLGKKTAGGWEGNVHETWKIHGNTGYLNNPIHHFPHPSISSFLKSINFYTDLLSNGWYKKKKQISYIEIIIYPLAKFIQNYIIRLGFLDGHPGLIMAMMMSFHSFCVRSKLWLLNHSNNE